MEEFRLPGILSMPPSDRPPTITHTFSARFDLIFSITPSFSKSKSSRKIISHMLKNFFRVVVHINQ